MQSTIEELKAYLLESAYASAIHENSAFLPVMSPNMFSLGIAERDIKGYTATSEFLNKDHKAASAFCDQLNRAFWPNRSEQEDFEIIMSSFGK